MVNLLQKINFWSNNRVITWRGDGIIPRTTQPDDLHASRRKELEENIFHTKKNNIHS